MTEQEAYDTLFGVLCDSKDAHYEGYSRESNKPERPIDWSKIPKIYDVKGFATLARAISRPNGKEWPVGKRVRITLASNMGDLGITDDLELKHHHSYKVRVMPGDGYLTDIEVCL